MQAAQSKPSSIEISANTSKNAGVGQESELPKSSFLTAKTKGIEESKVDPSFIAKTKVVVAVVKSTIESIKNHFREKEQRELRECLKSTDIGEIVTNRKQLETEAVRQYQDTITALTKVAQQIHSPLGGLANAVRDAGIQRLVDDRQNFSKISDVLKPLGINFGRYTADKIDQINSALTRSQVKEIIGVAKEIDANRVKTATALQLVHKVAIETFADIAKLNESISSKPVIDYVTSQVDRAAVKFANAVSYHIRNPDAKEEALLSAKNEFIAAYQKSIEESQSLAKSCKVGFDSYDKAAKMLKDLSGKNEVSNEPQMSVDRESSNKVYVKISPKLGVELAQWVEGYTKAEREKFDSKDCSLEERAKYGVALAKKMEEVDNAMQKLGAVLAKSHTTCVDGTKDNLSALDRLLQLDPTEDREQATVACQGILAKMEADTEAHIIGTLKENKEITAAHFEKLAKELAFTTLAMDFLERNVTPRGPVHDWSQMVQEAKSRVEKGFAALRKKEDEVVVSADVKKLADKVFAPEKKETTFTLPGWLEGIFGSLPFLFRRTK